MAFYNHVQLLGRCGHDIRTTSLSDGSRIARFRLYLDAPVGHGETAAQVHHLIAWNGVATQLERSVQRGDRLLVQGRLLNRTRDRNGSTVRVTEIHVAHFARLQGSGRPQTQGFESLIHE